MNLDELEALAKAAMNEPAPYVRAQVIGNYRLATHPREIRSLIALLREMGEALEGVVIAHSYEGGTPVDALAKFKEMTNEN